MPTQQHNGHPSETQQRSERAQQQEMPSIFLAHGSPVLLDDELWVSELHGWAQALPKPAAILMLSAHWVARPVTLGATSTVPLVYDFYGFPQEYYEVKYPAPGAPQLARRVHELLIPQGPVADLPDRGLDHGAYVPLVCMYPQADVPVLQVSLPTLQPADLFSLGQALAPLRQENVLIVGSGFITHNLRQFDPRPNAPVPSWAQDFDGWTAEVLKRRDVDALLDYRAKAPGVAMALPTVEHFVPLIAAFGAAQGGQGGLTFPITGFTYGSFTKRSAQFT
ncbi:MAG TPA: class III extradiol ring-cleavage dioxygenase [Polyangiaceae bacterium]|nr:class III extradiol ring-cleavage dioxygenase [Polyangiaceae bacterium]